MRNATRQTGALARARERRRQLDAARDEQDRRVEEATAAALIALDERARAVAAVGERTDVVGGAVSALLAENVGAARAAALLGLEVAEIRQLARRESVDPGRAEGGEAR